MALASLGLAGCGASGGGGGSGGFGPTIGAPCDPNLEHEQCSGSARVACTGTWSLLGVCEAGQICVLASGDKPGSFNSLCSGASSGGSDAAVGTDAAAGDGSGGADSGDGGSGTDAAVADAGAKDTTSGCTPASCDDGVPCTVDACIGGTCSHETADDLCDDFNPCSQDTCTAKGCQTQALAKQACDDGDPCTTGDVCSTVSTCVGKTKDCDDGDPCTADSCSAGTCKHKDTGNCADGSSMDKAIPLEDGQGVADDLGPSGNDRWFSLQGNAGDVVALIINSDQQSAPFDPDTIDTVVELYVGGKVYAANDDSPQSGNNDSTLLTMLPQSGTFLVHVSECWTWLAAHPNPDLSCASPNSKLNTQYEIIYLTNATTNGQLANLESEPNDSSSATDPIPYNLGSQGGYLLSTTVGQLTAGDKGDWFSFKPPTDAPVKQGRPTARFDAWASGLPLGNGSTLKSYQLTVVDKAKGTVLAQVQGAVPHLSVPVQLGATYWLQVSGGSASGSGKPFYAIDHFTGSGNPLEQFEAANDKLTTAEALTFPSPTAGGSTYFIGGDLINQGTDVDHFSVAIPAGTKQLSISCGAALSGSGLLSFTVAVLNPLGPPLPGGTLTEGPTGLFIQNLAVSSGKVVIKLSASGQSPTVTGAYYECGFHFQ